MAKVIVRKKEYLPAKMLQGWSDGALQFLLQEEKEQHRYAHETVMTALAILAARQYHRQRHQDATKVHPRPWPDAHPDTPALDAFILWKVGKMPGECYERIALKHGKEHWLYQPGDHGEHCPSNGENAGIECRCDECDFALLCFPEYT